METSQQYTNFKEAKEAQSHHRWQRQPCRRLLEDIQSISSKATKDRKRSHHKPDALGGVVPDREYDYKSVIDEFLNS